MGTVPSTHTFAPGPADSSEMNTYVRDPIIFLEGPPAATLRTTGTQSLTNNTWTAINFDAEDLDSVSGHSTSVNTSRYTAVYAGWYWCGGSVNYALNATGSRGARWAVNGTAITSGIGTLVPTLAASFGAAVPAPGQMLYLNVGDYVELQGFQNSGGALSTGMGCAMSVLWVSN